MSSNLNNFIYGTCINISLRCAKDNLLRFKLRQIGIVDSENTLDESKEGSNKMQLEQVFGLHVCSFCLFEVRIIYSDHWSVIIYCKQLEFTNIIIIYVHSNIVSYLKRISSPAPACSYHIECHL